MERLRQEYDKGVAVDLRELGVDVASVAGLMKLFLRELPDPLVSASTHHLLLKEWNKLLNFRAPFTASDCPCEFRKFCWGRDTTFDGVEFELSR